MSGLRAKKREQSFAKLMNVFRQNPSSHLSKLARLAGMSRPTARKYMYMAVDNGYATMRSYQHRSNIVGYTFRPTPKIDEYLKERGLMLI